MHLYFICSLLFHLFLLSILSDIELLNGRSSSVRSGNLLNVRILQESQREITGSSHPAYFYRLNQSLENPQSGKTGSLRRSAVNEKERTVETLRMEKVKSSSAGESEALEMSPESVREYRLILARELRQDKKIRDLARAMKFEAAINVSVSKSALTPGINVGVSQGSGHEILDSVVLDIFRQAVQAAMLPDSLNGKSFNVSVPLFFQADESSGLSKQQ